MNARDRISVLLGDIASLNVDAVVNAANRTLLGGGGVDGAIHRAAGPGLLEECRALGGCDTGQAKITGGHRLRARYVIHTVGPVWHGGTSGEAGLLASCYRSSMDLAFEHGLRTIAFPAISCGVYGYPPEPASEIAVAEVAGRLASRDAILKVIFVCFDKGMERIYLDALSGLGKG
jgi:O-acetyl-ADP-ribose deacetylase (regulator of RNase III)